MRFSSLALLGGAGLGVAAIIAFHLNTAASASPSPDVQPPVERFVLQASGDVPDCLVEKAEAPGPSTQVFIAPACDAMLPGLSALHYWKERPDGTVELSTDGNTPTVVFALSDGVAYESVEPRTPLMSLIAGE